MSLDNQARSPTVIDTDANHIGLWSNYLAATYGVKISREAGCFVLIRKRAPAVPRNIAELPIDFAAPSHPEFLHAAAQGVEILV